LVRSTRLGRDCSPPYDRSTPRKIGGRQLARKEEHDVIVVGGGAAGCVVAARRAKRGSRAVLLLEAGHDLQASVPEAFRDGCA
jgi:NADPH-dependent 2,4-dienoyl-CoA reductase/sulfur reductase-like enzyme